MAINTPKPISRDERYLSKIGGNEKVIVPKPISREEKYMYRAAGYDDQPIPDYPIGRNEKYWAKIVENGGGSEIGSTVTFDSGQKFISDNSSLKDYKIYGNGGEFHSTGQLPLTFTAKGGAAADWVIEGNDDNGTENFFDKTTSVDGSYVITTGTQPASNAAHSDYIPVEASQSYYLTDVVGISTFYSAVEYDNNKSVIGYLNISGSSKASGAITTSSNAAYVCINFKPANLDTIMLVKGSTAPDHYIPYQQGVGERTENLFDVTDCGLVEVATNVYRFGTSLGKLPAGTYTLSYTADPRAAIYSLYLNTRKGTTFLGAITIYSTSPYSFSVTDDIDEVIIRTAYSADDKTWEQLGFTNIMLVKGSTAPSTYVPYGYEIPISVNGTPQTFYIGSTPLTAGQSISKTSTGVDIELFEGENTVSTTLYNKPTMEIETSYGVGVKDNNHYIIPFKVNTTTYNIQIGDSPLYDEEYLSYKEKKLYKYIDSVLTPIDPPSPFPEISTTEGVNKVIIETSTQPDSIFITTQNPIKLVQPNIGTKTITQNGVYNASDDNLDGYSSVTVNTN